MTKRKIAGFMAAALLTLSSCGENPASTTTTAETPETQPAAAKFTASEITAAILETVPINSAVEKGTDDLSVYFGTLDTGGITEASYYICGSGAYPDEIAVLKFSSDELAEAGLEAVKTRLENQYETYESYTPKEMYKFDGAVAEVRGSYILYLVTADNGAAKKIADQYIPEPILFRPE